jgi:D-tyrosyl-tRNA(Tyr) deacylase
MMLCSMPHKRHLPAFGILFFDFFHSVPALRDVAPLHILFLHFLHFLHSFIHSHIMRVVLQRVSNASVRVNGEVSGSIGPGLLVLLGIAADDTPDDADWLARKIVAMRIFSDAQGLMNLDLAAIGGGLLVVSQFTLWADYKKGNRPSFIRAARPETAIPLYEYFLARLAALTGQEVQKGIFGADMQVSLVNDGPVTIIMDSRSRS